MVFVVYMVVITVETRLSVVETNSQKKLKVKKLNKLKIKILIKNGPLKVCFKKFF